ncbi:MAG: cupin domain-containing protein [Rhodospirillaceae bacterium]|nr:cupin domain-containing protein [Rhodospirillaceae bacterium]
MRIIPTLTFALATSLMFAGFANAQVKTEADSTFVIKGSERAATSMVVRADGKTVTYDAKIVAWPTASVKVLSFKKAKGGVLHQITDEKTIFVRSGSVDTTVDGKAVTLGAGDLASLPTGTLSGKGDAVVVAWTAGSLTPDAKPAVVRGADVKPGGAGKLVIKRYDFPGNSVRAVTLQKGGDTPPNSAKTDSLILVTEGKMRFHQDGKVFEVAAGDFIREVAGLQHNWEVPHDAGFVTTSALPIGAGPIDPNKATDRPK